MQKREAGKSGGSFTTPAKRGRPFGSTAAAAATSAAAAAAGDASSPASLLGPSLQITTSLAGYPPISSLLFVSLPLPFLSS